MDKTEILLTSNKQIIIVTNVINGTKLMNAFNSKKRLSNTLKYYEQCHRDKISQHEIYFTSNNIPNCI